MNSAHLTLSFVILALLSTLIAWYIPPLELIPPHFADEEVFLGLPRGKNVLSALMLSLVGLLGLLGRPRFGHGRDVLLSVMLCCLSMILAGGVNAWAHLEPSPLARSVAQGLLSVSLINASFALVTSQLSVQGRWWLLGSAQLLALMSSLYHYDQQEHRFTLMLDLFAGEVLIFSLGRAWWSGLAQRSIIYLFLCLLLLIGGWLCIYYDQWVWRISSMILSGQTLAHLLWSGVGACWLRYFIFWRPHRVES